MDFENKKITYLKTQMSNLKAATQNPKTDIRIRAYYFSIIVAE